MPKLKGYADFPELLVLDGESEPEMVEIFGSGDGILEKRGPLEVVIEQGHWAGEGLRGKEGLWSVSQEGMLKITGRHNKYGTSGELSELLTDRTLRLNEDCDTI